MTQVLYIDPAFDDRYDANLPIPPAAEVKPAPHIKLTRVGSGRASYVYCYTGPTTHETLCVKRVIVEEQPRPHDVFKEVAILKRIANDGTPKLLAVQKESIDMAETMISILMPFYPQTLSALLNQPSFLPAEAQDAVGFSGIPPSSQTEVVSFSKWFDTVVHLSSQLFSALAYLHDDAKIAHRDVKPLNIMLTHLSLEELLQRPDSLKLIDYGISTDIVEPDGRPRRPKTNDAGTGAFRAPDLIFAPQAGYDGAAVDVWAAGCVIAMFLTGLVDQSVSVQAEEGDSSDDEDWDDEEFRSFDGPGLGLRATNHADPEREEEDDPLPSEEVIESFKEPEWRRKELFDIPYPSDIPLAANIFQLKGLPSDLAAWPEAAHYNPSLATMPFARSQPTDILFRLPVAAHYINAGRDIDGKISQFVSVISQCTSLSAASRPSASLTAGLLSKKCRLLR